MVRLSQKLVEITLVGWYIVAVAILVTIPTLQYFRGHPLTTKGWIAFSILTIFFILIMILVYIDSNVACLNEEKSKLILFKPFSSKPFKELKLDSISINISGVVFKTILIRTKEGKKYRARFIKFKFISFRDIKIPD